jgi:hypothetical protein
MDIVLLPCKGILGGEGWNLFPISLAASFGTGDIPPGKVPNLISGIRKEHSKPVS